MPSAVSVLRPWRWATGPYLLLITLVTLLVMLAEAWWVFDRIPHLVDGAVYLFEANGLAGGTPIGQTPPVPTAFFAGTTAMTHTEWYGVLPWGYPLLLVPGVWLGHPWIINPLLGALCVPLLYRVGREWFDEPTTRFAVLLLPLSPWFTLMGGTFMSHTATAFMGLVAWWGVLRLVRQGSWGATLHTGCAIGYLGLCRPYTGLALALPMGAFVGWHWWRARRPTHAQLLTLAGILCVFAVGFMLMWRAIGPKPDLLYGIDFYDSIAEEIGFQVSGAAGQVYTPRDAFHKLASEWRSLHRHLFGAPWPGLWWTVLPILTLPWTRHTGVAWATAYALSLPAAYFFFYWTDDVYGPRYQFEATPALMLLTAQGARMLWSLARIRGGAAGRVLALTGACAAVGITCGHAYPRYLQKYTGNYVGPRDYLRPHRAELDRALIFLDSNAIEGVGNWILALNNPTLTRPIIVAHDLKHRNVDLARFFPDHPTYRYTILFEGDLHRSRIHYERFAPIDTAAELAAYLREELPTEGALGPSDATGPEAPPAVPN